MYVIALAIIDYQCTSIKFKKEVHVRMKLKIILKDYFTSKLFTNYMFTSSNFYVFINSIIIISLLKIWLKQN